MKKQITWTDPTGTEHEVLDGSIVLFQREDGKKIEIKFGDGESDEDCVVLHFWGGDIEFSHSYFNAQPPEIPFEERLASVKACENFQHRISAVFAQDDVGIDEKSVSVGSDGIGRIWTRILIERLCGKLIVAPGSLFMVDPITGEPLVTNENISDGYRPSVRKVSTIRLWSEDARPISIGEDLDKLVDKAVDKLVKKGWRYWFAFEERGNQNGVYIYATGC